MTSFVVRDENNSLLGYLDATSINDAADRAVARWGMKAYDVRHGSPPIQSYWIEVLDGGRYQIRSPSGAVVRNTHGEPFETTSQVRAHEAIVYLMRPRRGRETRAERRQWSHWVKSTFGMI